MISRKEAAIELLKRRKARQRLIDYILFTNHTYKTGFFSETICNAIDQFIKDVLEGKRPILILAAPPQHGKSEVVSRRLPAFLLGKFAWMRIGGASYGDDLAMSMARDVRRNLNSVEHSILFPVDSTKNKFDVNRMGEFTAPGGSGSYIGVGVGAGLTGRPLDIGIIDDPIRNSQEALSTTTKESIWNWYQTVFKTRLSEKSGHIVMATSWAKDDLSGRIIEQHSGDERLKVLRFPAINEISETGFDPLLPNGALVPELHPIEQLKEFKSEMSDYWWSALYQQSPRAIGGNVFKEVGIRYYLPKELPEKFDKVLASWDCTFKDTDGTDFVVGQVWGKSKADSYLLDQVRARMSFTRTVQEVIGLKNRWPNIREILIEDKANGPAVIDTLKVSVPGIIPIEPDGSKLAMAHAVTAYWEAGNIYLPHPSIAPWVGELVGELTSFPASAHDDQVDALSQALRRLYPLYNKLRISQEVLIRAAAPASLVATFLKRLASSIIFPKSCLKNLIRF